MKRLTVKLEGPKGSGKTTVARLIRNALSLYGINIVEVDDNDISKRRHQYDLNKCMESLSERVEVKIETADVRDLYAPNEPYVKSAPRKQWSDKEI